MLCAALSLQGIINADATQSRAESTAVFGVTPDHGSPVVTLADTEEQLVIDAFRIACSQRVQRRTETALLHPANPALLGTAWRHGAAFARGYVPPRMWEHVVPPSSSDPDA